MRNIEYKIYKLEFEFNEYGAELLNSSVVSSFATMFAAQEALTYINSLRKLGDNIDYVIVNDRGEIMS